MFVAVLCRREGSEQCTPLTLTTQNYSNFLCILVLMFHVQKAKFCTLEIIHAIVSLRGGVGSPALPGCDGHGLLQIWSGETPKYTHPPGANTF